jgi:hypothetical protein
MIGIMIPVNFANAWHVCDNPDAQNLLTDMEKRHLLYDQFLVDPDVDIAKKFLQCFEQNPSMIHDKGLLPHTSADVFHQAEFLYLVARSYDIVGDTDNGIYYYNQIKNDDFAYTYSSISTRTDRYLCWLYMDINEYSKALSITSVFADKCRAAAESALESNPEQQTQQQQSNGGGCLIATAAFGSEMAPQVQFLRELRDNTILQTQSGTSFMTGFNQFYYSFSPAVADYERENPVFKEAVKLTLTPLLTSLTLLQYTDIDSESEMLGYGIGVILLNIGLYFVAPAVLIMAVRKRI